MRFLSVAILCTVGLPIAQAQHFGHHHQAYLPIAQVHSLSRQLNLELQSFSANAHAHLAGQRNFDDVCDEIRDVQRELERLDEAIIEASRRPDRWDRVARRARELSDDIEDMREELDDVLRDRRQFFQPSPGLGSPFGLPQSAFYSPRHSGLGIALQFGSGRPSIRLVNNDTATPNPPLPVPTHGSHGHWGGGFPGQGGDACYALRRQAQSLQSLANRLVWMTRVTTGRCR